MCVNGSKEMCLQECKYHLILKLRLRLWSCFPNLDASTSWMAKSHPISFNKKSLIVDNNANLLNEKYCILTRAGQHGSFQT